MFKKIGLSLALFSLVIMFCLTGCSKGDVENTEVTENVLSPEGQLIEHVETQVGSDTNIVRFGRNADWEYNVYKDFVEILKCNNSDYYATVVVPSTIENLPVRVFDSGFISGHHLKKLVIPESVVYITLSYLNSWLELEELVFEGSQLIKFESDDRSDNGYKLSYFRYNSKLTNDTIQNIIDHLYEEVPPYMFYQCDAVETIVFKGNIKSIGKFAFALCENLESVELGESVEKVGDFAFDSSHIKCVTIKNPDCKLGTGVFSHGTELYGIKDGTASSYAARNQLIFNEISE